MWLFRFLRPHLLTRVFLSSRFPLLPPRFFFCEPDSARKALGASRPFFTLKLVSLCLLLFVFFPFPGALLVDERESRRADRRSDEGEEPTLFLLLASRYFFLPLCFQTFSAVLPPRSFLAALREESPLPGADGKSIVSHRRSTRPILSFSVFWPFSSPGVSAETAQGEKHLDLFLQNESFPFFLPRLLFRYATPHPRLIPPSLKAFPSPLPESDRLRSLQDRHRPRHPSRVSPSLPRNLGF